MHNILQMLELAELAAREAGRAVMQIHRSGRLDIGPKADGSPLTRADRHSNLIITRHLFNTGLPVLSEEAEGADYSERMKWEYFWMVDPLDGTKEFINGSNDFTVNIALMKGADPVAGVIYVPASDTTYLGSKAHGAWKRTGAEAVRLPAPEKRITLENIKDRTSVTAVVSRSHLSPGTMEFLDQFRDVRLLNAGSSLKFMMLIEGEADIYPRMGTTMEWDTAAAHAILHAADRGIYHTDCLSELRYNKPDLRNPFFIAF